MGPAGQKKSALQKIMFKYLCFWGGDFYSPPTKVLLMNLSNLFGDIKRLIVKIKMPTKVDI